MKIALYHNLPAGGALRYMREVVARSAAEHEYTEFQPSYVERDWALRPLTNVRAVAAEERRVAAAIDAGGFDVAFVHGCKVMQAPGLLTMLTTPTVYMIQEPRRRTAEVGYQPGSRSRSGLTAAVWGVGRASYDAWLGRRDRKAVAAATALACNSKFSAENIARVYGRDATVCYAGVDTRRFHPQPEGASARAFYVSVGALDPSKGHDLAIDAVSLLGPTHRLPLVIVGSRSDDATIDVLRARAAGLDVDLELRPSLSESELVDTYRNAAAALCMAHREPFGLTVHEAVACGTPVVAVKEGGFCETVVNGVNGLRVDRDPAAIADAIVRLRGLRLGSDPWVLHREALPWNWESTVMCLHEVLAGAAEGAT